MLSNILSAIAIVISLVSLIFTWKRTKKEQPLLEHEVFSCKHKVTEDGKTTDLELLFRLHNKGDRGTQLNRIEVYATDFNGLEHHSSFDLSPFYGYLNAHDSTKRMRAFFYFSPPFQYRQKMSCRFIIHHTTGKYPFKYKSEESEGYLEKTHIGWGEL